MFGRTKFIFPESRENVGSALETNVGGAVDCPLYLQRPVVVGSHQGVSHGEELRMKESGNEQNRKVRAGAAARVSTPSRTQRSEERSIAQQLGVSQEAVDFAKAIGEDVRRPDRL